MTANDERKEKSAAEREKEAAIEKKKQEMIEKGYTREQLWVTPDGRVLVDMEADALSAYNRVMHKDKSKEQKPDS